MTSHAPRLIAWIVLVTFAAGATLCAQDAAPMPAAAVARVGAVAPGSLTFRRVYTPEDRLREVVPRGFYPLVRDEFEQLAQLLQKDATAPTDLQGASFRRAEYYATLEDNLHLRGRAMLEVERHRPGVAAVPLEPLNLGISAPFWQESGAVASAGADGEGRPVVIASRERLLEFSWSRRGTRDAFGTVEFPLALPPSLVRVLSVDLPQMLQLEATGGVVEEAGSQPSPAADLLQLPPADAGLRRWRLELTGGEPVVVRIGPRLSETAAAIDVRQSSTYAVTPQGLSLTGELRLDVHGRPLREITLSLDDDLRLTAVRFQDQTLPLEIAADRPHEATLHFPEAIHGAGHTVRFAAQAATVLDRPWRLPRVRVQDVHWRAGHVDVHLSDLLLKDLALAECVQTQAGALGAGKAGQTLSFRDYSGQAHVTLVATREESRVRSNTGVTMDIGPFNTSATIVFQLQATQGSRFTLSANVAPEWIVDSVAAVAEEDMPADVLDRVSVPSSSAARELLEVRFARALDPRRPIRLTVRAHRRLTGEGAVLLRPDLRVIELLNVDETSRTIALEADAGRQVALSNDAGLLRLDPMNLPEEAASVVAASSASVVFQDSNAASNVRASLTRATPNFSAEVAMTALAESAALRESYRIRVTPVSSRVEQLRVHFSRRRASDLHWRLGESPEQSVLARRVETEDAAEDETWELLFERPRDAAFTLIAERRTEFASMCEVAFASLPQANAQQGELLVQSAPGVGLQVDTTGLNPTPTPTPAPGEYSTTFGAFRYEPAQQPAAVLERTGESVQAAKAWVWALELQSEYLLDGRPRHTAVFHVENMGRPSLRIELPPHVEARSLEVNGELVALPTLTLEPRVLRAILPPGVRFAQLRLEYLDRPQRLGVVQSLQPQAPTIDAPVLWRNWSLRLPSGLALAPSSVSAIVERGPAWDVRLLGPLRAARRPLLEPKSSAVEGSNAAWTTYRLGWMTSSEPPAAIAYREDVSYALAGSVFLVSAVLLSGWAARRGWRLWVVAMASATAALAAPAPYFMFFTAIFLSAPMAVAMRLSARRRRRTTVPFQESVSTTAAYPATVCVMGAAVMAAACAGAVFAQPEPTSGPLLYPVFIPIEADGRISRSDKYVYLPEPLYNAFRQAARRFETSPRPWLLRAANYRLVLGWLPTGAEIGNPRVEAELELEVLSAPCRVVLPLAPPQEGIEKGALRLDGDPLDIEWVNDGAAMAFDVAEAGLFRLNLEWEPIRIAEGDQLRIDFPIPPTPSATLTVIYPGDAEKLHLPSALGQIERDASSDEVVAELGPAKRLVVAWPRVETDSSRREPFPHVEQYQWLHVQPDALVLDVKWKFVGDGETISAIDVLADDTLTFLPSTARGLAEVTQVRRGDKQALRLQLDQPRVSPFEFQASFVVQGAVGVGVPHAPWLEVQHAVLARRWLAVSLDPTLETRAVETRQVERITETVFRSDWGEAPSPPHLAYRLLENNAAWSAQTRFRDVPLTSKAVASAAFRRDFVQLAYEADLDVGKGSCFQLRFAAPKSFTVEKASVVENGVERVDYWSQDDTGALTLFLNRRVTGMQRVSLAGRASAPTRGKLAAPLLSLRGVGRAEKEYRIYRGQDVSVRVAKAEGLSPATDASVGVYQPALGRLVAAYSATADLAAKPPEVVVELAPNRPRTSQRQLVTVLSPQADAWSVRAELEFQVSLGVIDAVRLEAPMRLTGPFVIDPPGQVESRDLPHLGRRLLTIRPDQPLSGRGRVRLSGLLRAAPGEAMRAPNIEPLDLGETTQFLVLPLEWQGQPIAWEPFGMRADALPPGLEISDENAQVAAYRVVNKPRYGAVVRHVEQPVGDPQAPLVDIRAVVTSPHEFFATAALDLLPAGLQECTIRLPEETRLVHAVIEGLARAPVRRTDQECVFDLNGDRLPLRLTVVYRGRLTRDDAEDERITLPAPMLIEAPVARTLWTVESRIPEQYVTAEHARVALPGEQQRLRLQTMADLLDLPADVEAGHSPDELARWYAPWAQRWADTWQELSAEEAAPEAMASLEEVHDKMAQRYGDELENAIATRAARAAVPAGPELWDESLPTSTRAVFLGAAPNFIAQVQPRARPISERSLALAAAIIVLSTVSLGFLWRADAAEGLARWFPFGCVLAGVGWWLWLAPSPAGLLIAAVGLGLSLRPQRSATMAAPLAGASTLTFPATRRRP